MKNLSELISEKLQLFWELMKFRFWKDQDGLNCRNYPSNQESPFLLNYQKDLNKLNLLDFLGI